MALLPCAAAVPPAELIADSLFGLVVSGRPVTTSFIAVPTGDGTQRYTIELPLPGEISELALFLLPGLEFPTDKGITVFFAPPPYETWATLGVLHAGKPSAVFRTGWPTTPEIASQPTVQLGISIDDISTVAEVHTALSSAEWDKLGFVQLVARDLFNYLQSFSQSTPDGERIVLKTDAVDTWMRRFETKYRHDPNFLLKSLSAAE